MINSNFLRLCAASVLLSTTLLGADKCVGGFCIVNLDNLKPSQNLQEEKLTVLESLDSLIDKSMTIVLDGEMITVFPHSSYVMNKPQVLEENLLVIESADSLEDTILEQSKLPSSEFFCEKNKKPLYDKQHETFQCV
ncbi:MAG: Unknown protein [uncultured Sulfurovum sp.]|uniref:Uncharacterized protein n=1 Tax=uncultured Sulfurovum sp. TaxID=269237 RepID=A0A6S6TVX9_9BACT|nr:MAG: Unknown protein [uncultured Sulfurovum sp.]